MDCRNVLDEMHRVSLRAGETLYREGDPAEYAYLILDGEMKMLRMGFPLAASRGSVIGFAGLTGTTYGSTATAPARCDLLAFTRRELRGIIRSDPDRALEIIDGIIDLIYKLNAADDATSPG
jgi:CRP-like cAMP-binding protein